jgi:hypothetical protein
MAIRNSDFAGAVDADLVGLEIFPLMSRKNQDYDEPEWKPYKRPPARGCVVLAFFILASIEFPIFYFGYQIISHGAFQ